MKESIKREMTPKEAVQQQREFFRAGMTRPYAFRMEMLEKLQCVIRKYEEEIKKALYEDLHKSSQEAYMTEIGLALSEISYVKKHLRRWMRDRIVPAPLVQLPAYGRIRREPYGTVLIMTPWNYPFLLNIGPLCDAIAAGNCCVLKPSAYAPAVSHLLKQMMEETFPPEYVTVIEGGRKENSLLLEEHFDYIFFTGSPETGKVVMEKAAAHLTPVTLELGGKSPCIVDDTVSIDSAAKRIVFGKFVNCGQTCVAPDYVLVQKNKKEELIKALKKWVQCFWGENPLKNPDYPKIITEKHFQRVQGLMKEGRIRLGGCVDSEKMQITPTIIDMVEWNHKIMGEEIFGPVLPILTYDSVQELTELLKGREKPLALYIFTESKDTRNTILSQLSFGGGCVNDTLMHLATPYMGFGGVGGSGMGSYHGKDGFETFSHKKSILHRGMILDLPVRYPAYSRKKEAIIKRFLR